MISASGRRSVRKLKAYLDFCSKRTGSFFCFFLHVFQGLEKDILSAIVCYLDASDLLFVVKKERF